MEKELKIYLDRKYNCLTTLIWGLFFGILTVLTVIMDNLYALILTGTATIFYFGYYHYIEYRIRKE